MGFLAPMMLLGGVAVGVPIGLHFFYKARYRPLPWAAMRFLKQSVEQTSRRLKFQEWVLLALRCLVLLLLALAISRPTFNALTAGGRGESVDAVLVFDTSYSMGAADGEKESRFDRAKAAALAVVDNLPPNSTVQVVTCSDRATHVGPVTPGNLDMARNLIASLTLTSHAGEILPGLTEAFAAIDRTKGTNKEVYLFTDLQKSGWNRQEGAVRAKASELRTRATLVVVRCGDPARKVRNLQIADITYPSGLPQSGKRLPVTVLVRNTGREPVRNASVTLEVDGKVAEREAGVIAAKDAEGRAVVPEVGPGQSVPVNLSIKFEEPGARLLTARIPGENGPFGFDDIPGDNRLDRLIPVRDEIRVLLVDGSPDPRDPFQAGSHFVRNGLLPVKPSEVGNYFVKVETVTPDEAGPGSLVGKSVCYLANVPATNADRPGYLGLSREFTERLGRYVRDGGGLVIGCGDNVVPASYNAVLGSAGGNLLPFDLGEVAAAPTDRPFKAAPDTTDATSFLARYREVPYSTVMADTDFFKAVRTTETSAGAGRVLMRLTDGTPLFASRPVGDGEVLFMASSLDLTWTNWPAKGGAFLSFTQLTLSHLTGRATRGVNKTAGEPLVWYPPESTKGFEVVRPDRVRVKLGKAQGGAGQRLSVTAADTPIAGIYQFGTENEDPPTGPRFTVSPDLRETDNLDTLTDAECEQAIGFRPVLVVAGADGNATLIDERNRREWTVWVLLLLFFAACGEAVFAWVCGKAW